ncbi:hypothetical protein [Rhizobium sp. BK379]|uniref:hypothetical protein n=1 Tax=Rhizobium sp. BK379 TaxID=2587059 RepID=UPI001612B4FB|nr:hypothetical protein [Rhizobium sp. BK379]MBB3441854.1 hypothetical protein [Rhizobium sp. BK379]
MRELEDIIFSVGQFAIDEHGVRFVERIENGTPGEYVVLVSREYEDQDGYMRLFAQTHFVARDSDGYIAMAIPLVESFSDQSPSLQAEAWSLQDELKSEIEALKAYALRNGRRAEFDCRLPLDDTSWDKFRRWVQLDFLFV